MQREMICKECGRKFLAYGETRLFCSRVCYRKHREKRPVKPSDTTRENFVKFAVAKRHKMTKCQVDALEQARKNDLNNKRREALETKSICEVLAMYK